MAVQHKILSIVFVFFAVVSVSRAQYIFTQNSMPQAVTLHPYAMFTNTGDQDFSVGIVVRDYEKLHFVPVETENRDLGFSTDNFWVRFELQNQTTTKLEYYLETARPITDLVELYAISPDGSIKKSVSGDNMPCAQRSYCHRKTIFPVELPANSIQQFYIHIRSDGEVISLPLMLRTSESLMERTSLEEFTYGIFYGILFIAAIIYMFFFFGLRERTFLFYSLYVVFIGMMQFSLDGYFYQYFTPGGGWFSLRAVLIFAVFSALFLGRYSQVFLNIKAYSRVINRLFDVMYCMLGILFCVLVLIPSALKYCYPAANILGLLVLMLIVASVSLMYYRNAYVDRFFTTGIFCLIVGFAIFILNNFGQIPTSFMSQNSSKFGTGLEVIFLSLSMANLIRQLKNEKEEFTKLALARSEEMNDMKSYFLSNISHELRTPLNAIMNLSNEMAKNADDEKIRQNAQVIKYSSHSLLSSVNDILDFSKIEKGELKLEYADFEPVKVLEHIKNNAAIRAKDQGLELIYSRTENIPALLHGDVARLAQIVNNVLSNAIKFTAEGFVKFHLSSKPCKQGTCTLTLTISDSGVGIPAAKMDRIFESFTQDNINNKRKFGGLGLGLYIVKALVDMQNGSIKMQSTVGAGTTCVITLDYEIASLELPQETVEIDYDLNGKSILVVEDNAINQLVIKMITKKWLNTTVVYTNNGREALEAFKDYKFDIVLMDLQMPVMDGYEATVAIRSGAVGDENAKIPIIAVTADVMETTKLTVKDIGMNDYLSKPLKNETLFAAVKALV